MKLIGVDVGGTFTDLVLADTDTGQSSIHKVSSTNADPSLGVTQGILELCARAGLAPGAIDQVLHGTTIATNAALEHRGALTGLITTRGYRDVLHIGRHQRPEHYSIQQQIPWQARPLVKRRHRHVVTERLAPPRGEVLVPLAEEEVREAARALKAAGVEAIAIGFLFSYLNPAHELRAKAIVLEEYPEAFVTTSAEVAPQFREFERFTTAAMNAFVGPKVRDYVSRLAQRLKQAGVGGELQVMGSTGGVASVAMVAEQPVLTMLSGPAAGVLGGAWAGALSGRDNLITFDIGGTSADIAIITEGRFGEASARDTWIAGFPLLVPMIDIHTIGAGGGSIARRDAGGAFRVGPQSAGAQPGPAGYGRGGQLPTVTDANIVLGRLDPENFLGGAMALDTAAAQRVVGDFAQALGLSPEAAALGILTIVNANMANAIRSRTVQKGIDPRGYALVAFGGAGPLQAVEVAQMLEGREVLVPPHPGITSAMGLLTTDLSADAVRTCFQLSDALDLPRIAQDFAAMEAQITARFAADQLPVESARFTRAADLRYAGQGYELRIAFPAEEAADAGALLARFHAQHRAEYGHAFPERVVEIVNLRVTGAIPRPRLGAPPPRQGGSLAAATVRVGRVVFGSSAAPEAHDTPFLRREALPVGQPIPGPAIILQTDSTTVVPPGCSLTAEAGGNLLITL
ncbi:hydantoinase/oxoprolinase family protein [Pseudoroseomonas cervicalis]|uniref:hydantoinase/oxoprolinase family protein n=1 Tax=Teichococcus cervicalis TaxID=204525 RepID=UPI0022F1884A|nr:hydantoinase/oxoprolinase family protein [Pseudoroseomonas cervicalis]WBV43102.1 hydantoinase/oxoprolinase family protein [Pseudoroseomonas cervicalis]